MSNSKDPKSNLSLLFSFSIQAEAESLVKEKHLHQQDIVMLDFDSIRSLLVYDMFPPANSEPSVVIIYLT